MKSKQFGNKIVFRVDKGEELVENIKAVCKTHDIKLGTISGIGATDKVTVGLLNTKTQKYQSKEFIGDHEIASCIGNITTLNGETYLHLHVTICNAEHKTFGGHLTSAVISAAFEGFIVIIDGEVAREFNSELGLNLLKL
jgi:uncharacterized protein